MQMILKPAFIRRSALARSSPNSQSSSATSLPGTESRENLLVFGESDVTSHRAQFGGNLSVNPRPFGDVGVIGREFNRALAIDTAHRAFTRAALSLCRYARGDQQELSRVHRHAEGWRFDGSLEPVAP